MKLKISIKKNWFMVLIFQLCVITNNVFGMDETLYVIPKVLTFVFFGVVLLHILHRGKIRYNHILLLPILFTVFCFATILWAYNADRSLTVMVSQTQLLFLMLFTFWAVSDVDGVTAIDYLKAVYISGFGLMLLALVRYGGIYQYIDALTNGERMGGAITNQNTYGMVFGNAALSAAYYLILKKQKGHIFSIILFSFFTLSSASRKAMLMIVIGVIFMAVLHYGWKRIHRTLIMLVVVLVLAFAVLQLPYFSEIRERLVSFFSGENDMSDLERKRMIELGMELFEKRPILGYGMGSFGLFYFRDTYSHNNYLELLVSGGVVALVLYYLILLTPAVVLILGRKKGQKMKSIHLMLCVWLLVELVFGLVVVQINNKTSWILIGVLTAEAVRLSDEKNVLQEKYDGVIS